MPINNVFLKSDAYLTCLSHALSTEREEIMGLLLGHVEHNLKSSTETEASYGQSFIESVVILQRSVRQADRVEISPLQLTSAAQHAEKLAVKLGKSVRVLGWYHSHPHITVQPSHVDIRTQANYQAMDPDFIGLIFSVFQQEANEKFGNTSLACFQSIEVDGVLKCKEILVTVIPQSIVAPHCLKTLAEIPHTLYNEEKELRERNELDNTEQKVDPILDVHNSCVFSQALCQLVECCEMPCISAVISYEQSLLHQLNSLKKTMHLLVSNLQ